MTTAAKVKKHCASMPGATHDIKWGADLCYSVGGRMFAVLCETGEHANSMSFKVDDHRFLELTDGGHFVPAPYLARAKWIHTRDVRKVADGDLLPLLTRSYEIIRDKLPKSKRP
jgi:predicted DNA-binding protein (MmcQ/YjbR family)